MYKRSVSCSISWDFESRSSLYKMIPTSNTNTWNYMRHCKNFFTHHKETCEFPRKIPIVAWKRLYDYVENFRAPHIVHGEIFRFLFDCYQSFLQWQSDYRESKFLQWFFMTGKSVWITGRAMRVQRQLGKIKHFSIEQSLTGFMNANVENWTCLIHLILDELGLH